MKTDTLIDMLTRGAGPAPRAPAARRLVPAAIGGLLIGAAAAIAWFGTLPAAMFATVVPWTKIAYAGGLALAAGWLTARLSRPAASCARARHATLAVIGTMATIGVAVLWSSPAGERSVVLLGESWLACPARVLALSLPALGAVLWAVRGLAPTRLRSAGFAAGMTAGSLGAIGYSLACPEPSAAFVALWYTVGIVLVALIGAALGPRVLRW